MGVEDVEIKVEGRGNTNVLMAVAHQNPHCEGKIPKNTAYNHKAALGAALAMARS